MTSSTNFQTPFGGRNRIQRFWYLTILVATGLFFAKTAPAQDSTSLKEVFRNVRSVKAEFLQKRYLQILTKPLLSEGKFFFHAPDSLRWEYLHPLRSVVLQKGGTIQIYNFFGGVWKPEIAQAVESRRMVFAEISQWLQGRFDESKVFKYLYSPGPPARITLIPGEGVNKFINRIEIVLSERPGVLDRVEIEEPGGSRTSIEFKNVEINSAFPSEVFEKP
ncbi:MAG TPA: outer membrane lipoprotein carrier protein LolA [Thermodesulfobacteriota bacterium]|nr:outer membrane lipoprotein carrier protein LolA [Thermodesulfobacteriota bacterium]